MNERKPTMIQDRNDRLKNRLSKAISKLKEAASDEWAANELARDNARNSIKTVCLEARSEVQNALKVARWTYEKAKAAHEENSGSATEAAVEKDSAARKACTVAETQAMVAIMNAYCTEEDLLAIVKTEADLMEAAPDEYAELRLADSAYDESVPMQPDTMPYERNAFEIALASVAPDAYAAYYEALLRKAKAADATPQPPEMQRI